MNPDRKSRHSLVGFLQKNSNSMSSDHQSRLCLAILVKPGTSMNIEALTLLQPFIQGWVLLAENLTNAERLSVRNALAHSEGHIIEQPISDYSHAKNTLLNLAGQGGGWSLLMESDERLVCLEKEIFLPAEGEVGFVRVRRGNAVNNEIRLFNSKVDVELRGAVSPKLDTAGLKVFHADNVSIQGLAPRQLWANDRIANRFLLDGVLGRHDDSGARALLSAKLELARGKLDLARQHFEFAIEHSQFDEISWQALYLCGGLYQAKDDFVQAIEHWHKAFEMAPDRAEPIYRSALLHFEHGDYQTAALLAQEAEQLPIPSTASYYEPDVYSYLSQELKARAWHKLGRFDDAIKLLNKQLENVHSAHIRNELKSTLKHLEEQSSTRHAKRSDSNPPSPHLPVSSKPALTVGMATHDDYDGVYFTVMSLVLYHTELLEKIEILIVDNNPDSKHGVAVAGLAKRVRQIRYLPAQQYHGTAVRERIFHEASADNVLCLDCHVFLHAESLKQLLNYFTNNPNSKDLLHGPIVYDDLAQYSTHMTPEWQAGFYGRWGQDERGQNPKGSPFDIPMQGLGLFACVKRHWPGFNPKFRGFGGEEGYIHEKFRQRGGRVLCLPFLRWTHRFDRPNSPTYPNSWEGRLRNYLIGWQELNLDVTPVLNHFTDLLGREATSSIYANFLVETASPLWRFDSIAMISASKMKNPLLSGLGAQNVISRIESYQDWVQSLHSVADGQFNGCLIISPDAVDQQQFESAVIQTPGLFNAIDVASRQIESIENPDYQAIYVPSMVVNDVLKAIADTPDSDPEAIFSALINSIQNARSAR